MKNDHVTEAEILSDGTNGIMAISGEADAEHTGENKEMAADAVQSSEEEDFDTLINGRYKKEFGKRVGNIIDRRFKEAKRLEAKNAALAPLISALGNKYNCDPEDTEKLVALFLEGESSESDLVADTVTPRIEAEAQKVSQLYPLFNFEEEMKDSRFKAMVSAGVPLRSAYECLHISELIDSVKKSEAKRISDSVMANGRRAIENGTSSQAAMSVGPRSVSDLSGNEVLSLLRRAALGERIVFK